LARARPACSRCAASISTCASARRLSSSGLAAAERRRSFPWWPACSTAPAARWSSFGENVERFRPEQRILFRRKNLGFVFQQYNLLPALTAAENAAIPLFAAGMKRREAVAQAKELLVRLGLENRLDTLPPTLSGGQQQRVALARALVHEPRLILCDEPTAALDHATGEAVMELLVSTAVQPDRAVIVVTHDTRVFHFADTIAHMDDGRITRVETQRANGGAPQTDREP